MNVAAEELRRFARDGEALRALILRQELSPEASVADRDVLIQVEAVEAALRTLGCETSVAQCGLDFSRLPATIESRRPDFVFNLVESLGGSDRMAPLAAAALESLGVPFTGSSFAAWTASADKLRAKEMLRRAGLPTPEGWSLDSFDREAPAGTRGIVKSIVEHASLGIDDDSIVSAGEIRSSRPAGGDRFVERFVAGREFNLSLLARDEGSGADVLPPAEIVFVDYPPEKPRIVGWAAKWDDASFEYSATPRRFDFPAGDASLLRELESLALACWRTFGLAGYARVDFRVDEAGKPWILEANANPCLAPDAGFAAALARAGIAYEAAIERIVRAALRLDFEAIDDSRGGPVSATKPSPTLRYEPTPSDARAVRDLVKRTAYFNDEEVGIAAELVEERLAKGVESGYEFVFADDDAGRLLGYACFGKIPCTTNRFDLYWIAVEPKVQGRGLGRELLRAAEERIVALDGARVYVDTSTKPQYAATRSFYERCGYELDAALEGFYGPGDGKAIYRRILKAD